jgi:hypothetical protein
VPHSARPLGVRICQRFAATRRPGVFDHGKDVEQITSYVPQTHLSRTTLCRWDLHASMSTCFAPSCSLMCSPGRRCAESRQSASVGVVTHRFILVSTEHFPEGSVHQEPAGSRRYTGYAAEYAKELMQTGVSTHNCGVT